MRIDLKKLTTPEAIAGDTAHETKLLRAMHAEAVRFISSFAWTKGIRRSFFGFGIGGIVGVFLFQIEPASNEVDEWLWTVVGDLPPAYLVVDQSPTPIRALETYVSEMQRWVDAARKDGRVDGCIPVNVEPSADNANALERRLTFLRTRVIHDG